MENVIFPSSAVSQCARARGRGAGPRTTCPSGAYCDPWHGHMNLLFAADHGTTQPKCVHTVHQGGKKATASVDGVKGIKKRCMIREWNGVETIQTQLCDGLFSFIRV